MRKGFYIFLASLIIFFCYLGSAWAYTNPKSVIEITSTKVAENIYVLHGINELPSPMNQGLIANLGFIVTDIGIVVIDSGSSKQHAEILIEEIKKVSPAPIIAVFNTHIHGDHWLGNQFIAQQFPETKFYAHQLTINAAKAGAGNNWIELFSNLTKRANEGTQAHPATASITNNKILKFGEYNIQAIHTERAHTDGDLMLTVQHPDAGEVIFLGDVAMHKRIGGMDDGSFSGNIAALGLAIARNAKVYVPGHGPSTKSTIAAQSYYDYLSLLYRLVAENYKSGLMDFEIKEKILPQFASWSDWEAFDQTFGRHVNLVYLEIEEASF